MVYYSYFALFLVLLKVRYELFCPLDSLWTGGELLLYSLNLPRVDYLFAFTEKEQNTQHIRHPKWSAEEHFNTLIQETAVPGTGMYMTDLSARDNTGLKGRLGRTRRGALRQAAVVCFCLFFFVCFFYTVRRWIKTLICSKTAIISKYENR